LFFKDLFKFSHFFSKFTFIVAFGTTSKHVLDLLMSILSTWFQLETTNLTLKH
jgi:hypothetical protein